MSVYRDPHNHLQQLAAIARQVLAEWRTRPRDMAKLDDLLTNLDRCARRAPPIIDGRNQP